jgi:hypothetical protein
LMKNTIALLVVMLLCIPAGWGQTQGPRPVQPPQGDEPPAVEQQAPQEADIPEDIPDLLTVPAGTHVAMTIVRAPQEAQAKEGDRVYLRLRAPLHLDPHTVIPARTLVVGVLTNSPGFGGFGMNSTGHNGMSLRLQTVVLPHNYRVPVFGRVEGTFGGTKDSGRPLSASNPVAGFSPEQLAAVGSFALVGGEIGRAMGKNPRDSMVGTLIGAGIGVATILAVNNSRARLDAGNNVEAVLERPLAIDPRYLP